MTEKNESAEADEKRSHFIKHIIDADLASGKNGGKVMTRFPPEPNGYLHIGHAKSICLNFGLAEEYKGLCNLRFDDTNPEKEDIEYVRSIQEDIRWLGFDWEDRCYYASDYFEQLYDYAVRLIDKGKAYVCSLTADEMREYRGTLTEPGKDSPYRDRSIEENRELFEKMRAGEFEDGKHVLRAKIDMASDNLNLRDPVIYRIRKATHHATGDKWCIYPMYDYAHGLSDAIEGITHSICTLEFEDHRPLYDWILDELETENHPQQIEFARLNMNYLVMSKRRLRELVEEKHVESWDDPRMPTLSGFRRRGYPPEVIRDFCERIGVAKANSVVDFLLLVSCLREFLNARAERRMAVLDPLKLVITNYPEGQSEELDAVNNPNDAQSGIRKVPFSRELYIEREDFLEDAPKKFFRLSPGREVRLQHGYYVTCTDFIKDESGVVQEVHCTYDPDSRGGQSPDGRKVKGTLHWVSVEHAFPAEVRLYDHLFIDENPDKVDEGKTFLDNLNPDSLKVIAQAFCEPALRDLKVGENCQFLRQGYFCLDNKDSSPEKFVFNRTVGLRDSWAKVQKGN